MAITVEIGDRSYEVAVPYALRQLEEAAPCIDAVNERIQAEDSTVVGLANLLRNTLGALLPGIRKAAGASSEQAVTLEELVDQFRPDQLSGLQSAFAATMGQSGLGSGEAKPAQEPAPEPEEV